MRNSSKHVPTDSYFYTERQLAKCMIIFNIPVGPVIIQTTNTQRMNNYETSIQNIPNLHGCSSYESKSKGINADTSLLHVYSTDES